MLHLGSVFGRFGVQILTRRLARLSQSIRMNDEIISELDPTPFLHIFKLIVYCLTVGWDVTIFPLVMCRRHYLHFQSSRRRIIMCWVITVVTQGIPSLSLTKSYFSVEFRMGTVCSNETSVNCRPMWHFVSSFRTRPGRCEFFFSSDALLSTLLLLTLCTTTSISVKQMNKT